MRLFSIRKTVLAGAIAALALGSAMLPNALTAGSTPTAQAAELAQPAAGPFGPIGPDFPSSFHGHRHFFRPGFSHAYWGYGYARWYPQYYTAYYYEPVSVCSAAYYFDDDAGVWYCFTGY